MVLNTVKITGTFNFPDASWTQHARAVFILSGFDTDTGVVTPDLVTVNLGPGGELDVDLWPNTAGLRGTIYRVYVDLFTDESYSKLIKRLDFGRIQISGPANIADLLDTPVSVPGFWYSAITLGEYNQMIEARDAAAASAASAAASFDEFDDRFLGAKAVAPTLDNDGNALLVGAVYWNTVSDQMFTWSGTEWLPTFRTGNTLRTVVTATAGQTVFTTPTYRVGANTLAVFVNGLKVLLTKDYTETDQNTITFTAGRASGDVVELIAVQSLGIGETTAQNVSFTQAGTGAVERTVDARLKEFVSVKDFGAVGDGVANDTAAVQAAIDAAFVSGKSVFAPAGDYYCPGGLVFSYTTTLYGKPVLVGEGASNTRFSTNTATPLITITGQWSVSEQQRNAFTGFSVNYTGGAAAGVGVRLTELSYCGFNDIAINRFANGLIGTDVIAVYFYKCMFVANTVGVLGNRAGFSNANAWGFYGCTLNGNTLRAMQINKGATLSLDSCTLEGNGEMATAETCAVYVNGSPNEGASGLTARNCYFEGNKGEADVILDVNDGDGAMHSFIGCTFNRISSTNYVTNNIKLMKSGTGFLGLTVAGCGFRPFNTYSPNSGRRCIAFSGSLANDDYQVTLLGNYFSSTVDVPVLGGVASSQKAFTSAWVRIIGATGGVVKSHNIASVSRTRTGVYVITFAQPFKSAGHSVSVLPIGVLGFGALVAETANTITVETYNGASVLTDWPAVSVTVHSE